MLDWKTYIVIPVVAALVGWFTNYLAVQMIFYPIQWRGIPLLPRRIEDGCEQPFGWIGWQGIVPAKTAKMTKAMVNVTINQLLSMDQVIQKLDPDQVAEILSPKVPDICQDLLDEYAASTATSALAIAATNPTSATLQIAQSLTKQPLVQKWVLELWLGKLFLRDLTKGMQQDIQSVFSVDNCVVNEMMADRSLLGKLFQKTGGQELDFLVQSGLWFGFLLGILQMILALVCQNPWTMSTGGLVVGLATNWMALKWIFEPVTPTKVGPVVLQGLFLRRQPQVAKDFSRFFAKRILNSQEMWKSIVTDPTTSPNFCALFTNKLVQTVSTATNGNIILDKSLSVLQQERLNTTIAKVTKGLPDIMRLTNFHQYVDETLEIEKTLKDGLRSMSSKEFEQVLHPIFEEDELTLILAGGFLGFAAGLVQQLLATGVLVVPPMMSAGSIGIAIASILWSIRWWKKPRRNPPVGSIINS